MPVVIRDFFKKIYHFILGWFSDPVAVKLLYFRVHFRFPNLKNPRAFNEKIAWRKLHQHNPLFPVYADKIAVKPKIAELIGPEYLIETLWTGDDPDAIPFDSLEPPYVLKVNHSTGGILFVRSGETPNKRKIIASLRKQLVFSHGREFREWGYTQIRPQIIIERMIDMQGDDVPEDYKFFVFHGHAHIIQVDMARFKKHTRNFYDREWNLLPFRYGCPTSAPTPKPAELEKMIALAEKIGAQFDFARVDLYATPKGILFGEVTFYPAGGVEKFTPKDWDYKFGDLWKL